MIPYDVRIATMSTKLYIGNLSFQTSSEELKELFSQSDTVESASVVEDLETGRSRGFKFVEMSSREDAERAITQFNGIELGGRALKINEAESRKNQRGQRGFGSYRGPKNVDDKPGQRRLHVKTGDQECLIEIVVDDEGKPIEGHAVIFSPAEEKQVAQYLTEIADSRKRSNKTLNEIERIKKKTEAILNELS
jgi:RNA recognition motif-containing protein